MAVVLVEGTEAVVLVNHIVHLQLWRPALPDVLRVLLGDAQVFLVATEVVQAVFLQRLVVAIATGPEGGGDVETARTVVHVKVVGQCVTILVYGAKVILKTQTFALCLLQRDAHHGFH